jgi:hypothetical protein
MDGADLPHSDKQCSSRSRLIWAHKKTLQIDLSLSDREADAAERRVRVRRGAPGAAHRAARHRPEPGTPGAEPYRQDPPGGGRQEEAAQGGGPGHGEGLLHGGVGVPVRPPRRALRLLRERRPAVYAGLRQGDPVHHVRQHEDLIWREAMYQVFRWIYRRNCSFLLG